MEHENQTYFQNWEPLKVEAPFKCFERLWVRLTTGTGKLASQDIPTSNILLKETPASEPSEDPVDEDKNRASSSEPSVTFDACILVKYFGIAVEEMNTVFDRLALKGGEIIWL
ncbi:hypothetical protein YC2023_072750 [Brassica napus]